MSLGDHRPIEWEYRLKMNAIAQKLDHIFNGEKQGDGRDIGFVLLVFPFGSKDGRCNYISNGADRRDIASLLREQAAYFEEMA